MGRTLSNLASWGLGREGFYSCPADNRERKEKNLHDLRKILQKVYWERDQTVMTKKFEIHYLLAIRIFIFMNVLGCRNKLPQTGWFITANLFSLTSLEAISLKSRGW